MAELPLGSNEAPTHHGGLENLDEEHERRAGERAIYRFTR